MWRRSCWTALRRRPPPTFGPWAACCFSCWCAAPRCPRPPRRPLTRHPAPRHAQAGRPPFRGATEYLTYQAVLSRDQRHPDDSPPDAVAAVEALLHVDPAQRCGAARGADELRELPFLRDAPWDDIWNAQPPPVLQPPIAEAAVAAEVDERWELTQAAAEAPFGVDALRSALPAEPPFALAPGESVTRAGRAARKRGASREQVRLMLTSLGRLALVPDGGGAALLELANAPGCSARALDSEHLAFRMPTGGEAFLQLLDGDAAAWAAQLAQASEAAVRASS